MSAPMCSAPDGVMNVESFMIDFVVKGLDKDSEKFDRLAPSQARTRAAKNQ